MDTAENTLQEDVLLLPHPDEVPGHIKALDIVNFIANQLHMTAKEKTALLEELELTKIKNKRFNRLKRLTKFKLLLALTAKKQHSVYLFHDLTRKMPIEAYILLKERMNTLAGQGALVLFLTEEHVAIDDRVYNTCAFWESTRDWSESVTRCREIIET